MHDRQPRLRESRPESTRHGANCGKGRSRRTMMSRSSRWCNHVSTLYLFRPPLSPSPSASASPATPDARSQLLHISLDSSSTKAKTSKALQGRLRHPLYLISHTKNNSLCFLGKSATPQPQVEYNDAWPALRLCSFFPYLREKTSAPRDTSTRRVRCILHVFSARLAASLRLLYFFLIFHDIRSC